MTTQSASSKTMAAVSRRPCDPVLPPPDDACCQVSCLIQPRFFCGQLLTDTDLQAMVDWSRQRFGLARYRDGWGIVCGLHVRADRENPSGVILEPGYAIDCCGNDIIVCADAPIDLTSRLPQAGCDHPGAGQSPTPMHNRVQAEDADQQPLAAATLDLVLHYQTQGSLPQTALGRGSCATGSACEYSRTLETYFVEARLVQGDAAKMTPREASIQARQEEYQGALAWALRLFNDLRSDMVLEDQRTRLNSWLNAHPPEVYPSLAYDLDDQEWKKKLTGEYYLKLLLDYRLSLLRCRCFACKADSGLLLGRVYLEKPGANVPYRVVRIYDRADYQRRMSEGPFAACADVWPGCLETGSLLRESRQTVTLRLYQSGFKENQVKWETLEPKDLAGLKSYLEILKADAVVICPDQPDSVTVYTSIFDGAEEVIGFTQGYRGV